jgi:hypothetical protein
MSQPKCVDCAGRVWHPRVTTRTVRDFELRTDRPLLGYLVELEAQFGGLAQLDRESPEFKAKTASMLSTFKWADLLTLAELACRAEIEQRKITPDEFVDSFDTIAGLNDLAAAIGGAAMLFFQSDETAQSPTPAKAAPGAGKTSTR